MTDTLLNSQILLNTISEGVIQCDLNGVVVLCNKAAQQIVGLTKKQIVGKSFSDKVWSLICEDKTPFLNENHPVTITLKTGKSLSNITMGVNRTRSELKWILMNSTPLYDNSKHINGVLVTFSDITNYKKNEFELREKELKYHQIINTTEQGFMMVDKNQVIIEINQSFANLVGYHFDKIVGKKLENFLDEKNKERLSVQSKKYNSELNRKYQFELLNSKGLNVPVILTATSIVDNAGKVIGTHGFYQNIKELVDAQTQSLKLKTAIDQSPSTIVITDLKGNIEYVNPQFVKETGYTIDEVLGENPRVLKSGFHDDDFYEELWDNILNGKVWHGEFVNRRKDGSLYWENAFIAPVFNDFNEIINFVAIKEDITKRKEFEKELIQSELKFRNAFEYSGIGMALVSLDGAWLKVNQKLCEFVGYEENELLDKTFQEITHPDDLKSDLAYINQMLNKEINTYEMEKRYIHKDGSIVWVLLNVSLVLDVYDQPLYFISQVNNITKRKTIEFALLESENRFRSLFENASIMVCLVDKNGNILTANQKMAELTGYDLAEICNLKIADLDYRSENNGNREYIIKETEKNGTASIETFFLRKDKTIFPVLVEVAKAQIDNEVMYINFIIDTTERKKSEAQIVKLNNQLKDAQQIAKIGSWSNIFEDKSIEWSDAIYDIFGYVKGEEIPHKIFYKHIHIDDRRVFWS